MVVRKIPDSCLPTFVGQSQLQNSYKKHSKEHCMFRITSSQYRYTVHTSKNKNEFPGKSHVKEMEWEIKLNSQGHSFVEIYNIFC